MTATKNKTKVCTKCHHRKSLDKFGKNRTMKNGYACWCRLCMRAIIDAHRHTLKGSLRHRFNNIKRRCTNHKTLQFKNCGGRGTRCLISFDEFYHYITVTLGYNSYSKIKKLLITRQDINKHFTISNLRIVTQSQKNHNERKWKMLNGRRISSRFKGVTWCKRKQKWQAQISINSKTRYLGYFDKDEEETAARTYDEAALEHYGELGCTNQSLGLL